jgi:hypothetical protein
MQLPRFRLDRWVDPHKLSGIAHHLASSTGNLWTLGDLLDGLAQRPELRPRTLRLESVDGLGPDLGRLVVQIRAAGVKSIDTYIRAGARSVRPSLAHTPGFDGARIVVSVGEHVEAAATACPSPAAIPH